MTIEIFAEIESEERVCGVRDWHSLTWRNATIIRSRDETTTWLFAHATKPPQHIG